jgi:hypothetical protein
VAIHSLVKKSVAPNACRRTRNSKRMTALEEQLIGKGDARSSPHHTLYEPWSSLHVSHGKQYYNEQPFEMPHKLITSVRRQEKVGQMNGSLY